MVEIISDLHMSPGFNISITDFKRVGGQAILKKRI